MAIKSRIRDGLREKVTSEQRGDSVSHSGIYGWKNIPGKGNH